MISIYDKQFFFANKHRKQKTFSFPKKSLRNVFQNISIVINLALKTLWVVYNSCKFLFSKVKTGDVLSIA